MSQPRSVSFTENVTTYPPFCNHIFPRTDWLDGSSLQLYPGQGTAVTRANLQNSKVGYHCKPKTLALIQIPLAG